MPPPALPPGCRTYEPEPVGQVTIGEGPVIDVRHLSHRTDRYSDERRPRNRQCLGKRPGLRLFRVRYRQRPAREGRGAGAKPTTPIAGQGLPERYAGPVKPEGESGALPASQLAVHSQVREDEGWSGPGPLPPPQVRGGSACLRCRRQSHLARRRPLMVRAGQQGRQVFGFSAAIQEWLSEQIHPTTSSSWS